MRIKKKKNRKITQVTIQSELCRKRLTRATKMIFLLLFILSGLSFNKDCESNSAILKTISRVWGLLAAYSGKASMTVQHGGGGLRKTEKERTEREREGLSLTRNTLLPLGEDTQVTERWSTRSKAWRAQDPNTHRSLKDIRHNMYTVQCWRGKKDSKKHPHSKKPKTCN